MLNNNLNVFRIHIELGDIPRDCFFKKLRQWVWGLIVVLLLISVSSCKKFVKVAEPVNSITTEGAFSTDVTATSAIAGIYSKMVNTDGELKFGSGATTLYVGLSSDELTKVGLPNSSSVSQFYSNSLLPNNGLWYQIWEPVYFTIFQANSAIEGLNKSTTLTPSVKQQLIGECKFLRAFCFFYLTNLWGDVPMPLTGDWNKTHLLSRTKKAEVYSQIVNDLKEAQNLLPADYSISNGERIRANKFAATALLARVYLYLIDWENAEVQATSVINNYSTYSLVTILDNVFLKNSKEAILQLQPSNRSYPFTVLEGNVIPEFPFYYLTDTTAKAFEIGDERKSSWTDIGVLGGKVVFKPFKYKMDFSPPGGNVREYYMVLRLAEQYLIRAEARAKQNKINEAIEDLNIIRSRAQLSPTLANDQSSLLLAIEHERQVELFAEWGHRWLDLIRTNRASVVLTPIKGNNWQSTDVLYPIPYSEIQKNQNLSQNLGY